MVCNMNITFTAKFEVKWSDVDPNLHMRHTVYLDYADQTRIKFFNENGLPFNKLMRMGIGPILFGTETRFLKEVLLSEMVRIDCELVDIAPDGRKWVMKHRMYKENGEIAAEMIYRGAWFDLKVRKVAAPPKEVFELMNSLNKAYHEEEKS